MTDLTGSRWEPWRQLSVAIVEAQIEDYRSVLRRVDILVKRDDTESLKIFFKAATEKEQIERFFNSDWCEELRVGSGYSGPYILEQLKKQYPIDEKLYQKRLSEAKKLQKRIAEREAKKEAYLEQLRKEGRKRASKNK